MLLGAAAQIGIFLTFIGALILGFLPPEAGAIGIIGGADGPTAIFLSSKLANGLNTYNGLPVKNLIGPIAIAAYSYMALVPVIQPPVMRLLTSKKERLIKMKPPRVVPRLEKILSPIVGFILTAFPMRESADFGKIVASIYSAFVETISASTVSAEMSCPTETFRVVNTPSAAARMSAAVSIRLSC